MAERPSFDLRTPDACQSSSTQDSVRYLSLSSPRDYEQFLCLPQPLEDGPTPATSNIPDDATQGHHQSAPRKVTPPRQATLYDSVLVSTTTVDATVGASEQREGTDANYACTVPGCGSTFAGHCDLEGALLRPLCETALTCCCRSYVFA